MSTKSVLSTVAVAFVSCVGTLGTAWLAFEGQTASADVQMVRVAYERMEALEERLTRANAEIITLNAKVMELTTRLEHEVDVYGFLSEFADAFPYPAWVQRIEQNGDEVRFRTIMVNRAYEYTHSVTRRRYAGALDVDIWQKPVADQFRDHNQIVLRNKAPSTFIEEYPDNPWAPIDADDNPMKERTVVRIYLRFFNNQEYIFGMALK